MKEFESPGADIDEYAGGDEVWKQRCPAVAHERQRYPDNRHNAEGHADIDKEVRQEHERYPEGEKPPELVLC